MTSHAPMSMAQTFNIELGARLHEGLGSIGKFDGKNPNFVGATNTGLVVVHDPNETDTSRSVRHHNINRPLSSIGVCNFSEGVVGGGGANEKKETESTADPITNKITNNQVLLLGSPTSLLVYDVHNNTDLFYREIGDGVNAVTSGKVWKAGAANPSTIALAGGNGSVQGYDREGQEAWWTVAGDNVGSIAVVPTSEKSSTIAVGSDDFEIRFYQGESLAGQVTETDQITRLVATNKPPKITASTGAHQLGYALGNGTIGVYGNIVGSPAATGTGSRPNSGAAAGNAAATRKWRYKSKNTPTSIAFGDVDLDGVEEMLVGWSNGRFEIRSNGDVNRNGEVIFKETLQTPVASVAAADYRNVHRDMPLVATSSGELLGFVPVEAATDRVIQSSQQLEKLMEQKLAIEHELQAAERALTEAQQLQEQHQKEDRELAEQIEVRAVVTPIPTQTRLELVVSATGGAVVHSVLARADVVLGANDAVFAMNTDPHTHGGSLAMNIETVKDLPGELYLTVDIQRPMSVAVSSSANNAQFESRTFSIKLPKFCMYAPLTAEDVKNKFGGAEAIRPEGAVTAKTSERASRVAVWAQSSFIGFANNTHNLLFSVPSSQNNNNAASKDGKPPTASSGAGSNHFEAYFKCLRRTNNSSKNNTNNNNNKQIDYANKKLVLPNNNNDDSSGVDQGISSSSNLPPLYVCVIIDPEEGLLRIHCDDLEVAGEFLQDLASYMSISELSSTANFPKAFGECREVVQRVNDLNEARLKLTAEMADSTQLVKSLTVKLEDSRSLLDFQTMRKTLDALYEVNGELMGEHLKRSTNHTELLGAIKSINNSIQLASRLRVGEAKNNVVTLCRTAVKDEKMDEIVPIFEKGTV